MAIECEKNLMRQLDSFSSAEKFSGSKSPSSLNFSTSSVEDFYSYFESILAPNQGITKDEDDLIKIVIGGLFELRGSQLKSLNYRVLREAIKPESINQMCESGGLLPRSEMRLYGYALCILDKKNDDKFASFKIGFEEKLSRISSFIEQSASENADYIRLALKESASPLELSAKITELNDQQNFIHEADLNSMIRSMNIGEKDLMGKYSNEKKSRILMHEFGL